MPSCFNSGNTKCLILFSFHTIVHFVQHKFLRDRAIRCMAYEPSARGRIEFDKFRCARSAQAVLHKHYQCRIAWENPCQNSVAYFLWMSSTVQARMHVLMAKTTLPSLAARQCFPCAAAPESAARHGCERRLDTCAASDGEPNESDCAG